MYENCKNKSVMNCGIEMPVVGKGAPTNESFGSIRLTGDFFSQTLTTEVAVMTTVVSVVLQLWYDYVNNCNKNKIWDLTITACISLSSGFE